MAENFRREALKYISIKITESEIICKFSLYVKCINTVLTSSALWLLNKGYYDILASCIDWL